MLTAEQRREVFARLGPEIEEALRDLCYEERQVGQLNYASETGRRRADAAHDRLLLAIDRLREGGNGV